MPKVAFIATGGTIAAIGKDELDVLDYASTGRRLSGDELLSAVPRLRDLCTPIVIDTQSTASSAISLGSLSELRTAIDDAIEKRGAEAVVVLQGTSAIEETSFFLNLTLRHNDRVVVVGAMRPPTALCTDAYANILDAVRVAVDQTRPNLGVVVVALGRIYAAHSVVKTSTYAIGAISSSDGTSAGTIDGRGRVRYRHGAPADDRRFAHHLDGRGGFPRVYVVGSYLGNDGSLIDMVVASRAHGLVIAGMGAGKCTTDEFQAAGRAREAGLAVVMSSRTGSGRVELLPRMQKAGLIAAGGLSPAKARILLMLGLTRTDDRDALQTMFDAY